MQNATRQTNTMKLHQINIIVNDNDEAVVTHGVVFVHKDSPS